MFINTTICSKEFNQGIYAIRWRYHVDEYGTYWYNFNDVVDMLALKWKTACKLYDEFLNDNEKIIFEDSNNDCVDYRNIETKFISSTGFDRLMKNEDERHNRVKEAKKRLEFGEYNNELTDDVYKLYELVNQPLKNHMEIIKSIDKLYYSDYRQCAINNLDDNIVNKTDELKEKIIKAYDEDRLIDFTIEEEIPTLNKRKNVVYKRYTGPSTCPSWIRNVVK